MSTTSDRNDPRLRSTDATGQQETYLVLSDEERSKGFVRPVRTRYIHLKCGTVTTMGLAIAETYARNPSFYGSTFCVGCRSHCPVGENGEFVWAEPSEGTPLGEQDKVGT